MRAEAQYMYTSAVAAEPEKCTAASMQGFGQLRLLGGATAPQKQCCIIGQKTHYSQYNDTFCGGGL